LGEPMIVSDNATIHPTAFPNVSKELQEHKMLLNIGNNYVNNPLTRYNKELWKERGYEIQRIVALLRLSEKYANQGKEPDEYLSDIRRITDPINEKMADFCQKIIEGK